MAQPESVESGPRPAPPRPAPSLPAPSLHSPFLPSLGLPACSRRGFRVPTSPCIFRVSLRIPPSHNAGGSLRARAGPSAFWPGCLCKGVHARMCVCVRALSHFSRVCDPTDCSLSGSSVHGTLQARILEWVAMPSSRGSSRPETEPPSLVSPALGACFFTTSATWEALSYGQWE